MRVVLDAPPLLVLRRDDWDTVLSLPIDGQVQAGCDALDRHGVVPVFLADFPLRVQDQELQCPELLGDLRR